MTSVLEMETSAKGVVDAKEALAFDVGVRLE